MPFERISLDHRIMGRVPCIRGTRIPVATVVGMVSHHLFAHPEVDKLVNLQEVGGQAKPYQFRQFLPLVERYGVRLERR